MLGLIVASENQAKAPAVPKSNSDTEPYLLGFKDGFAAGFSAAMAQQAAVVPSQKPIEFEELDTSDVTGGSKAPYISKTPFTVTKELAFQYLQSVAPRMVGPTEIVKNVSAQTGNPLSYTTVKRALEALVTSGKAEQVGDRRWRAIGARVHNLPKRAL
jgi:hypothetical protein